MPDHPPSRVAVIGGGPAGLMAAEVLALAGIGVDLYEAMPSPGRKFLMAGKGGMNITHAEPFAEFCARYGNRQSTLQPLLDAFPPQAIRDWMQGLGIASFVGTSHRVFPVGMKAAPLLRAWVHRLRNAGVRIHVRHRWCGLARSANGYHLAFNTPDGERTVEAQAAILALGGGSWAKLGSDGAWVSLLEGLHLPVAPLRPANCGFDVDWSPYLRERFAGQPVKNIAAAVGHDTKIRRRGEFIVTEDGIEGGLVYALSARLRDRIADRGSATLTLDLLPDVALDRVVAEVTHPRGSRSLASHLQGRLGLKGIKQALLHECLPKETLANPVMLAAAIKALPLHITRPRPLDEAISSAGGLCFEALDDALMVKAYPGLFCAGEMLDWEAPTGGYLLSACLAGGRAAGQGALAWLKSRHHAHSDAS